MRLEGDVAIVTGGASGIGRAIAILFSREGAKVVVADLQEHSRLPSEVPTTAEAISQAGGQAIFVRTDVRKAGDIDRLVQTTLDTYGQVSILVNSAGVFVRNPITEVSEEEWDNVLSINLKGYFLACRRVIPEMLKQGGGKIINISSIHGLLGTGIATTYCASKGGVENLTRQLAVDYARKGIYVNAIAPGTIKTAMSKPFRETPEILQEYLSRTLLPRLGEPEDVAYAALFLASHESDFVVGHTLVVDGGWTIW
ncbi:MAG: SDR family oxidoreductase [Chloroflexi bacterium]|nr:SDR family oxidoreductase [Chloroflexota bacterium]